MPITDSRLGPGTLTIGTLTGTECQIANVRLVPEHSSEDGTPTLCDPDPAPENETDWSLQGTVIQDWENDSTTGFVEFCRVYNNTTQTFEWVPATGAGVTYSGSCQVRAIEIGGDVGVQITSDFEFPVVGEPSRVEA